MSKKYFIFLVLVTFILFNSCIGLSLDISMRKDGSGKVDMEYRISNMAEVIGRLDGNQNRPVVPVGRADWERTVARLDGVKMSSFSMRTEGHDTVIKVSLNFDNIESLLKIISAAGTGSSPDANTINIILNKNIPLDIDKDLLDLVKKVCKDYSIALGFSKAGAASTLAVTDGKGNEILAPAKARVVTQGKKVSFAIDTADVLELYDGLGVRINY